MKNELINVNIENREGKTVVSSRVIAKELNKQHKNVKRDIKNIVKEIGSDLSVSNVIESEYKDASNRTQKEYLLTKDGFTLYMFNIQGYNDFKMAYINRFNEMERQLQEQNRPSYTIQDPIERAKQWIKEQEERQLLEAKLEEQRPKVETFDRFISSDGTMNFTDLVKQVEFVTGKKIKQTELRAYLVSEGLYYKQGRGYTISEKCVRLGYGTKMDRLVGGVNRPANRFTFKLRDELVKYFTKK